MPQIFSRAGNLIETKEKLGNGSNTFLAGSFVKIASGVLAALATGDSAPYGYALNPSVPAGAQRPNYYWLTPYVYSLLGDLEFVINVSDASSHVGQANGAPQLSAAVLGSKYGIVSPTSGTYNGYQFLNTADTTNTLFIVTGVAPGALATDYNGLAKVRIDPSKIVG